MSRTESAYNALLGMVESINRINDAYPRNSGTLVMVSDEVESEIECIVNRIYNQLELLRQPEMVEDVSDDDQQTYLSNLARIQEFADSNRDEIIKAREFLATYLSR